MSRYTPEQLELKAKSKWTIVQYIGAPVQMLLLVISLVFVILTFSDDKLFFITNVTILIKIVLLYFMFITGMFWEKEVMGKYYLSKEFFWEDIVSTWVLLVHTVYLVALFMGTDHTTLMYVILVAYISLLLNAIQYLVKLLLNPISKKKLSAQ